MTRNFAIRAIAVGLAFVVGFGLAYAVLEISWPSDTGSVVESSASSEALPDPLESRSRPASSLGFVAVLLVVATGALWLGRRRVVEPDGEVLPEEVPGPHLIFDRESRGRRKPPEFYEDLRQRETTLESLEARGPDRERRKVIELPVGDRRPSRGDRWSSG